MSNKDSGGPGMDWLRDEFRTAVWRFARRVDINDNRVWFHPGPRMKDAMKRGDLLFVDGENKKEFMIVSDWYDSDTSAVVVRALNCRRHYNEDHEAMLVGQAGGQTWHPEKGMVWKSFLNDE